MGGLTARQGMASAMPQGAPERHPGLQPLALSG